MQSGSSEVMLFFERTPFMAVELLDLFTPFEVVCYDDDAVYRLLKHDWAVHCRMNADFASNIGNDTAVEIILDDADFLSGVVRGR
jgi:hypothetical protein